jgi:hypothetical protein
VSQYSKAFVRVGDNFSEIRGLVYYEKKLCVMYFAEDDVKYKKFKRKISLSSCIPLDDAEIISEKDYWHKNIKQSPNRAFALTGGRFTHGGATGRY